MSLGVSGYGGEEEREREYADELDRDREASRRDGEARRGRSMVEYTDSASWERRVSARSGGGDRVPLGGLVGAGGHVDPS
jgi:hypothetical protein